MAAKSKPLSREQIAVVHVAAHQLRMSNEEYRALLMGVAGVNSSRGLDEAGFRAVMRRFEQLGFTHGKPRAAARAAPTAPAAPGYGEREGMATPAQVRLIRKLWAVWTQGRGDASESERALNRWIEGRYHVSNLRFVDVVTAQKALEGLKAMTQRSARTTARSRTGGRS